MDNNSDEETHQDIPYPRPLRRDENPDMDYENTMPLELKIPVRKSESCFINAVDKGKGTYLFLNNSTCTNV